VKSKVLRLDVGEREGDVPKQEAFVMDNETPFLLWRGGRGCSKTTSGWARMLRRRWNWPMTKGLILAPDYPKLEGGVIQTVLEWLNPDHIESFSRSPPQKLVLVNGSFVEFYTASDPNVTRSLEANDIWFDEYAYCPYQTWRIALGAKRRPAPEGMDNSMWATGTPQGYDWSFGVFGEEGKPGYKVFETSIYENRKHLPKGYIEDMEDEYRGTDFEEQELLGKYTLFEGLVYPQFDEGNFWTPFRTPTFSLGVGGIDLGDISPSVLVPMGIDKGQLWVPEEFYQRRVGISDLFIAMQGFQEKYGIAAWFCETTAESFILTARAQGFDVRPCPVKDVQQGVRIVQQYFRDNLIHIDTLRNPNGLRELRSHRHKPQNLGESFSDSLVPADDHYPSALRYGIVGYEESGFYAEERQKRAVQGPGLFDWGGLQPLTLDDVRNEMLRKEKQAIGAW